MNFVPSCLNIGLKKLRDFHSLSCKSTNSLAVLGKIDILEIKLMYRMKKLRVSELNEILHQNKLEIIPESFLQKPCLIKFNKSEIMYTETTEHSNTDHVVHEEKINKEQASNYPT